MSIAHRKITKKSVIVQNVNRKNSNFTLNILFLFLGLPIKCLWGIFGRRQHRSTVVVRLLYDDEMDDDRSQS